MNPRGVGEGYVNMVFKMGCKFWAHDVALVKSLRQKVFR